MTWHEFAAAAPELAGLAHDEFERTGMALVGTIRKDGSPRISCVRPTILGDELSLEMMWRSRKAVDLVRDPRVLLHNAICSNRGDETELSIRGRVIEVHDDRMKRRLVEIASEWEGRNFHLFSVGIHSAAVIRYERGHQHVQVWPAGTAVSRRY